jgi:hypothetical protein
MSGKALRRSARRSRVVRITAEPAPPARWLGTERETEKPPPEEPKPTPKLVSQGARTERVPRPLHDPRRWLRPRTRP